MSVHDASWPAARLNDGLLLLAQDAGMEARDFAAAPPEGDGPAALGEWVETTLARAGLEGEAVRCTYGATNAFLRRAAPAVVRVETPPGAAERVLLLAGARGGRVILLGPDGARHAFGVEEVRGYLWSAAEEALAPVVDRMLADAEARLSPRVRARLLREHLGGRALSGAWLLRLPPAAAPWMQARRARLASRLAAIALTHVAVWGLFVAAWVAIGRGALEGTLEAGWLAAWALLLLTGIPFRLLESWMQGTFALDVGALVKRRLLAGSLKLDAEETRHQGVGQFLGRVLESETVETLALGSGFLATTAAIELAIAAWVLAQGPGATLGLPLLALWIGLALLLGAAAFLRSRAWTRARLAMTHDLVERMVGHRTRQAQAAPESWHEGEDELLASYLEASARLDRTSALLSVGLPGAWLAVGMAGLAPAFLAGETSPLGLAVGLGGVLLAQQAVARLTGAVAQLASLRVAWEQIRPLYRAAARAEPAGVPGCAASGAEDGNEGEERAPLLEARGLGLRYSGRSHAAVDGCDLSLERGDRALLVGPSGGGKSSLIALLLGLRAPTRGSLLLHGLDRATWGAEGWRRRISGAPQAHENHVFAGTMAFNLLLARGWPPTPDDLAEARVVCDRLGLGPLIDRMPAGLQQVVGETGWQLSHGERSRLFIARALLQGGDLQIFDESFAALDPGTLRGVLGCVIERARTILVVAHP